MIFNEKFYESETPYDPLFYVRVAGEVFPDTTYCIERKNSETGEIGFILSGKLDINYAEKHFILTSGDSFIFPPLSSYIYKSDKKEPVSLLWVNVRGSLFAEMIKEMFPGSDFPLRTCSLEKEIRGLFLMLCNKAPYEKITSAVMSMMVKMYSAPPSERKSSADSRTLAGQFENYISNSMQTGFSIDSMCEYFDMSKDKLIKIFRKNLNTTPYRYYQKMRMDIAKSLLLNSDLSIDEIAYRLKFNDRNHFTGAFIKSCGISPAKFRSGN